VDLPEDVAATLEMGLKSCSEEMLRAGTTSPAEAARIVRDHEELNIHEDQQNS